MVRTRCRELGIEHVHQGVADKLAVFTRLCARLKVSPAACCCIGDDLPDLPLMRAVACSFAVADAHLRVRRAASRITRLPGGSGAVREVCDLLLAAANAAGKRP
jgi:3-deoxy-D-manno-octulosonate 8-phosphate phosphatase (KDO 8-P phosphatase)